MLEGLHKVHDEYIRGFRGDGACSAVASVMNNIGMDDNHYEKIKDIFHEVTGANRRKMGFESIPDHTWDYLQDDVRRYVRAGMIYKFISYIKENY